MYLKFFYKHVTLSACYRDVLVPTPRPTKQTKFNHTTRTKQNVEFNEHVF
jgi:hypothetical protein